MPQSYYALRDEDDGSWSVIDLSKDEPVTIRNRSLVGLNKQEAYDAIRLLAIVEQLRRGMPDPANDAQDA
ncbi:hypothetical protein [Antarcticirhabdus aurantiaca]|uniref:Uncharacterized protein n=1 Tax=Antarcticirhabdus aurantiaca TaxID=2606717 RepID=A0ACD4NQR3_9HYPH|nr:hypothetical protein [Antarcticirhabdus aurantiaca]WAJ29249.1 hypothetical protein OXU80_03150 [Jeongeuplla avenae]